jgi:hypothetical protein
MRRLHEEQPVGHKASGNDCCPWAPQETPRLSERRSNARLPDGSDYGYGTACQDIGRVVLASAGTWTVNVFSSGGSNGAYAFVVSRSEK